jgi:hypothetical protein
LVREHAGDPNKIGVAFSIDSFPIKRGKGEPRTNDQNLPSKSPQTGPVPLLQLQFTFSLTMEETADSLDWKLLRTELPDWDMDGIDSEFTYQKRKRKGQLCGESRKKNTKAFFGEQNCSGEQCLKIRSNS